MTSAISRAFTPGGGEAPEAVAQRAAGQARIDAEAAAKAQAQLTKQLTPQAPTPPPVFSPGASPAARQRSALTASTMLGAAAANANRFHINARGREPPRDAIRTGAEIVFEKEVWGPLAFGFGSHFGLGLLQPADESMDSPYTTLASGHQRTRSRQSS